MFLAWFVQVVFSADEAVRRCKDGEKVILVRIETSPDDIHGLHAAEGVLTTRGGSLADSTWLPKPPIIPKPPSECESRNPKNL